jgi:hypothetical protein
MHPLQKATTSSHPLTGRATELEVMRAAVNEAIGALRAGRTADALLALEAIPVPGHFSDRPSPARTIKRP